jgi:hypothetical protein
MDEQRVLCVFWARWRSYDWRMHTVCWRLAASQTVACSDHQQTLQKTVHFTLRLEQCMYMHSTHDTWLLTIRDI